MNQCNHGQERAGDRRTVFFVIRWPDHDDDDAEGTLFLARSAARAYAERIIRELKDAGGYDEPGLTMIVEDDSGQVIYSIPF